MIVFLDKVGMDGILRNNNSQTKFKKLLKDDKNDSQTESEQIRQQVNN